MPVREARLTYQTVQRKIERRLNSTWHPGDRLPTISQLARELNVGYNNTHRAVNELVRQGKLVTRRGVGTFVPEVESEDEYIDDEAFSLVGKRVAILRSNTEPFLAPVVEEVKSILTRRGAKADLRTEEFWDADLSQFDDIDAAVLINPLSPHKLSAPDDMAVVVVDTSPFVPIGLSGNYDFVTADSEQGSMLAGQLLHRLGVKDVCYVGNQSADSDVTDPTSAARLRGFELGWGKPVSKENQLFGISWLSVQGARVGAEYAQIPNRPKAVFCASDDFAVGFLHGAYAVGLEAGKDYMLIGFDGQQRGREIQFGPLTTVDVPTREMGRTAAQLLTSRLLEAGQPVRRVMLACSLFEGKTTPTRLAGEKELS